MSLRDYLHFNKLKASEFARMLDVTPTYLRLIKNNHFVPSKKLAAKIELITGGQVTFEELRP